MVEKNRANWLLPVVLLALSVVPLVVSVILVVELLGGGAAPPGKERFFASPVPTLLHLVSSSVFSVLGAFQFAADFRRQRPGWHRRAGWILMVCGFVSAFSGLWMTLFFPPVEGDGELLYWFRLGFGAAMVVCMVKGFTTIRRRDIAQHRAWITRGYAIGIGAGTQVVVHIPWLMMGGRPDEFARSLLVGSGWAINLAVAEWSIRRWTTRKTRPRAAPDPRPAPK